jgi:polyhydroxyalkanoate synthesis regulator phasin
MKTEYEKYKEALLESPEIKAKYLIAKEKLDIELMLDSIDEAIDNQSSYQTIKRRISKLRKHIAAISL